MVLGRARLGGSQRVQLRADEDEDEKGGRVDGEEGYLLGPPT